MKYFAATVSGVVFMLAAFVALAGSQPVSAAACANVSSFGAVNLNVPELPQSGEYVLWLRMQASEAGSKVLAEVNQKECFEINAAEQAAGQWEWQTYRIGGDATPVQFASSSSNTIKLIGVDDGVKIDRILLAEPGCTPVDFGNNCQGSLELTQATDEEVITLAPPSESYLTGRVILSSTPVQNQSGLERVEYIVNGRIVQSSSDPLPFDTTLIENGKHTIRINTVLNDGRQIKESTVIEVKNPENFLTPAFRWIKLNWNTIKPLAISLLAFLSLAIIIRLVVIWLRRRRERSFHGF